MSCIWFEIFAETSEFQSTHKISSNQDIEDKFERYEQRRVCNFETIDYGNNNQQKADHE